MVGVSLNHGTSCGVEILALEADALLSHERDWASFDQLPVSLVS